MKYILHHLLGLLVVGTLLAGEMKEAPTEIKLKSGTVLRRVEVVRYETDRVVLKHAGGTDPFRLDSIAEPWRGQLLAYKKEWAVERARQAGAQGEKTGDRVLSGQVFVTTRGAGAYKFAGAVLHAYPAYLSSSLKSQHDGFLPINYRGMAQNEKDEAMVEAWKKTVGENEFTRLAKTTTDAEGNYRLNLKDDPVVLVCFVTRQVGLGAEHNAWVIEVAPDATRLDLNNLNQWVQVE